MNPDSTSDETADPTSDGTPDSPDGENDGSEQAVTRRGFVKTAAGTAAAAGATVAATEETEAQAQTYRFGGEVAGWHGRAPPAIEGQTNPTIQLQAGTEYEFWFENLDGQPHNLTIQDAEGSTVVQSELVTGEGSTASVTFTATSSMAQYVCTVHPTTMVGDLEVTGQAGGGGGGGFQLSPRVALFVAALVLAFVSPLLFALFLFSRRGGEGETPAG